MLAALRRGVDPGLLRGIGGLGPDERADERADEPAPPSPVPPAVPPAVSPTVVAVVAPAPPASGGPRFDVSGLLVRAGVARVAPRVDVSAWGPGFWSALEQLRHHPPATLPEGADPAVVEQVVTADGIPLVGVPRAGVVSALLAAHDRAERLRVLLAREDEVLSDCRDALRGARHAELADDKRLARASLDAYDDGHHEAAAALAGAVGAAALRRCLRGPRTQVVQQVLLDPDLAPYAGLRLRAALAPLLADRPAVVTDRGEALVAVAVVSAAVRALAELRELVDTAEG